MDEKAMKKIADQFDELAAAVTAIAGSFRAAAGGGKGAGGDGAAGGKSAKSAPAKGKKDETDEITEDTLRERLKELAATKGKDAMAAALAEVDAERLPDVDEDEYEKLNDKITELLEAEDEKPAKGKKAAKTKEPEHDFDDLKEKFDELDAKAKKAVLKACGVKKVDDIDEDDEDEVKAFAEAIEEQE